MNQARTISILPDDLRELEKIAAEDRTTVQKVLNKALTDFIIDRQASRDPQLAACLDQTMERNRHLYELLAE